jgi:hypothetical protein
MTLDERDLITGRVLREWQEAKTRLAAMKAKASQMATLLHAVGSVLEGPSTGFDIEGGQFRIGSPNGKNIERNMDSDWPSWQLVRKLISDVEVASGDFADAERRRVDLGS